MTSSMRGRGRAGIIPVPQEWRGSSNQVCGLYPFSIGAGAPMVGVPLGTHLFTGATVCFDPISWFTRAGLLMNPSAFVMSIPGIGKSSLARRIVLGLAAFGYHSMILGDIRPDYVDLVQAMGGQVIRIGRGLSKLNPLDISSARQTAALLPGAAAREVLSEAYGRQHNMLVALVQLSRGVLPSDRERTILKRILEILNDRCPERSPVIGDVLSILREGPDEVRAVALDRGDLARYKVITEDLEASLISVLGGVFGDVFADQTTTHMQMDRSVCFDISSIADSDEGLQAAALLTCWTYGFGVISNAQVLADYGVIPRQLYHMVVDEMWRALRAGPGMVDRFDRSTRLNRRDGTATLFISHTMKDLESLPTETDRVKARGFVERAGAVLLGGLPASEMPLLDPVIGLSQVEKDMVTSWDSPEGWDAQAGHLGAKPGTGKFLIKVGGRPGIPLQVKLTAKENAIGDTNKRWHNA